MKKLLIATIQSHRAWHRVTHLKNPNDAAEIEDLFTNVPSILENRPDKVKKVMETIRPGNLSDYSKYLAESLSVFPFIYNNPKSK